MINNILKSKSDILASKLVVAPICEVNLKRLKNI